MSKIGPGFPCKFYTINPNRLFRAVQKMTLCVHILNRFGPYCGLALIAKTIATNLAIKGAAADFKSSGSLMFIPADIIKHPLD